MGSPALPPRRLLQALVVGLAAAALFLLLAQARMPGDAAGLVAGLDRALDGTGPDTFWYHLAFAWVARGLAAALPWAGALGTLQVVAALAAGLAIPLAWLALRRLGVGERGAAGAALLLALSPGLVQHATIVEVHGLQLAAGLAALALVARARDAGPAGLAALGLGVGLLVNLAHQTGPLLFPGLVLAAFWGAGARPLPDTWPGRAARFGAASAGYLAALALARLATDRLSPFPNIRAFEDFAALTAMLQKPIGWSFLRDELLVMLPVLLACGALGAVGALGLTIGRGAGAERGEPGDDNGGDDDRPRARRDLARLGLVLVLVPWAFFLLFGERTEGGYFVGAAPGLVLLTGLFLDARRPASPLPLVLLALASLLLTWRLAAEPGRAEANVLARARVAAVAELLPAGGTVYALQYNEHTLAGRGDALVEVSDAGALRAFVEEALVAPPSLDTAHLPGVLAARTARRLARLEADRAPVVVDWTWAPRTLHHDRATWRPYLDAIRAELDRGWEVTEHHGRWGTLLALRPR